MRFSKAVVINPKIDIKKGEVYPFVDMQSLTLNNKFVEGSEERVFKGGGAKFENGDTLMARITPCLENGKIAQYKSNGGLSVAHGSTEFIVFRGREGVSDNEYVYYLTRSDDVRNYAIGQMTGTSGRQRVPTDCFDHLEIELPSLNEQRAIAKILSDLDAKIDLNRRMNETLEQMARTIFKKWFVDFEFPSFAKASEGKPGHEKTKFVDGLPEGWRKDDIGNVVTSVGGGTPSTKEKRFWDGNLHFVTPKDLASLPSPVLLDTERCITEEGLNKISSGLLPKGTVLLSSRAPVGYLAISEIPVAVNQGFIAMICNKELPNYYVLFWTIENLDTIKGNASGTTFPEISKKNFRPIKAIIPLPEVLEKFVEVIEPIYRKIVNNLIESNKLITIRDTLLPKLMSGEIRV